MRWFADRLILFRMEIEPIGPKAVHDWHRVLADRVDGVAIMPVGTYLAVTS